MPVPPNQPLNVSAFCNGLIRLLLRYMKAHAFCEITVVLQDGKVQNVRVNQHYRPNVIAADTEPPAGG